MFTITPSDAISQSSYLKADEDIIQTHFNNFEVLSKLEKWEDIISQGKLALTEARRERRFPEEAKICAQLTSTSFYQGNYSEALSYANRCHELAEEFSDPTLFIRALYLESAVHRALAGKGANEQDQQGSYQLAVEIAEESIQVYTKKTVDNPSLKGKVYFNLGAAHADNPKGNLEEASRCYIIALESFKDINATEDFIRTSIRLGKVFLLKKEYVHSQKIIDEVRLKISTERLAMHADYLEAQLKLALKDFQSALRIAEVGLARAKSLGAREDEIRLISLMEDIAKSKTFTNTADISKQLQKKQPVISSKENNYAWPVIVAGCVLLIGYIAMRVFKPS